MKQSIRQPIDMNKWINKNLLAVTTNNNGPLLDLVSGHVIGLMCIFDLNIELMCIFDWNIKFNVYIWLKYWVNVYI